MDPALGAPATDVGGLRIGFGIFSAFLFIIAILHVGLLAALPLTGTSNNFTQMLDGPPGDTREALFHLKKNNVGAAKQFAYRALANDPLNVVALRVVGLASDKTGDPVAAARFMNLAGELGWRDTPVQLWLTQAAIRSGDWDSALIRADALARREQWPRLTSALFVAALATGPGREALARQLSNDPPWRGSFFYTLGSLGLEKRDEIEALIAALARNGSGVSRADLNPYVTGLVNQGKVRDAFDMWRRYGRRGDVQAQSLPSDGNFRLAQSDGFGDGTIFPFEWRLSDGVGGDATIERGATSGKLVVRADGTAATLLARQVLPLTPGRYRLAGSVQASTGASPLSAFEWTVSCLPGQAQLSGQSASSDGRLDYVFSVPATACEGQFLDLKAVPTSPNADATASFGSLRIDRLPD
jgi:hypothetical protein